MIAFNAKYLESGEVVPFKLVSELCYYEARKETFFRSGYKAGFYATYPTFGYCYSTEDLQEGKFHGIRLFVNEGNAFFYPYVVLTFTSGQKQIVKFQNINYAISYAEGLQKGFKKMIYFNE